MKKIILAIAMLAMSSTVWAEPPKFETDWLDTLFKYDRERQELNNRCGDALVRELSRDRNIVSSWKKGDMIDAISDATYSPVIDGCIAFMWDDLRNRWMIFDLHNILLDQWLPKEGAMLFVCDKNGIDNVVVHKARLFSNIGNTPYREYLDDGNGGLPRALKTPTRPYTRSYCRTMFDRRVEILKGNAPDFSQPFTVLD